jgi:tRNA threonylcarbamoyladenosine biosynthesis protein TsaB
LPNRTLNIDSVPNLLAIEASADACSVALLTSAGVIERNEFTPRQHSQLLLPMVDALLQQGGTTLPEIDAIAFSAGPGSFTGLRLALGVAQGLAFGANIPLIATSSLATLAQAVIEARQPAESAQIFCVVDARMGECYVGHYEARQGIAVACAQDSLLAPADVKLEAAATGRMVLVGNMASQSPFADHAWQGVDGSVALARHMLPLARLKWLAGEHTNAELAQPVYLRGKSGWKSLNP